MSNEIHIRLVNDLSDEEAETILKVLKKNSDPSTRIGFYPPPPGPTPQEYEDEEVPEVEGVKLPSLSDPRTPEVRESAQALAFALSVVASGLFAFKIATPVLGFWNKDTIGVIFFSLAFGAGTFLALTPIIAYWFGDTPTPPKKGNQ